MDFFARLMGQRRGSGGGGEDVSTAGSGETEELSLTPGLDREIEGEEAAAASAEEHQEPQ